MDYKIKDLPKSERPREKIEENGVSSLTNPELLSILLRTGTSGKNVKELSIEILESYSIRDLADIPMEEFEKFDGVSSVKSGQLKAIGELSRRMKLEPEEKIEGFEDAKSLVEDMKFFRREKLRVFVLSSGNEVLAKKDYHGSVDSAPLPRRKILKKCLNSNGKAVLLAHNHPSGNAEPTKTDIKSTEKLVDLASEFGVVVLDHVIVGRSVTSMKQERLL